MVSMEMSDMLLNKSVTAVGESRDHCVSACSALVYRNTGAIYFSEFSLSFFLPTHPDTGGEMMEECFFFFFLHLSFHIFHLMCSWCRIHPQKSKHNIKNIKYKAKPLPPVIILVFYLFICFYFFVLLKFYRRKFRAIYSWNIFTGKKERKKEKFHIQLN